MGYVGNTPAEKYASFAVQNFTVTATTNYTLDHPVANENDIRLVINNVVQHPGSGKAYTASGTTLTLSEATAGTDTMYCVFLGKAVQTVTPANSSVTNDMLAGSIANSKLANSSITLNGSAVSLGGSATVGLSGWSEDGADNDLLPSNASSGIYLGVNSATASNLLDDYEEGTFVPSWTVTGATLNAVASNYGRFTKIGGLVHVDFGANITTSGGTPSRYNVTNMPFQSNQNAIGQGFEFGQTTSMQMNNIDPNSTTVFMRKYDGTQIGSAYLKQSITYHTSS